MTKIPTEQAAAATANLNAAATGVDRRTLDAIFRHPLSHNLSWREVVGLFDAIGAAEEKHNGEFVFRAGEETLAIKKPHGKDLTGPDVIDLRHFLARAGWAPDASAAAAAEVAAPAPRMIVVIDHAGAKVYPVDDDGHGVTGCDPKHLPHHLERKRGDDDRDETWPEDAQFFERVADAVSVGGEIVVIGHGQGQSNEADHLSAYLQAHHKQTWARIVRAIVADVPHLTTPELLALGRHAFARA